MAVSKSLLTEFGIDHRLESCVVAHHNELMILVFYARVDLLRRQWANFNQAGD